MSFDKTDIIVQTLESQIEGLKGRVSQFGREALEHDGATQICKLIAQESLGLLGVVESRLAKEGDDVADSTKDLVRGYAKNLIKHFHTIATSNGTNQSNQAFITRGRAKEAETQADMMTKEIASQRAFAENRDAVPEEVEDVAGEFDMSDVPVEIPGARLPEPLPEPPTPEPDPPKLEMVQPEPEPEPESEEPKEEKTSPGRVKKPNRRKLSRGKK